MKSSQDQRGYKKIFNRYTNTVDRKDELVIFSKIIDLYAKTYENNQSKQFLIIFLANKILHVILIMQIIQYKLQFITCIHNIMST